MDYVIGSYSGTTYVTTSSARVIISTPSDVLELMAFAHQHATKHFLLKETNFTGIFYDLKTGLAGEILQKFSDYGMRVAILGSFRTLKSNRFRELMHESNKGIQVRFSPDEKDALAWLMS